MSERADAIVIGGGHNGLVAAGFLAKAGLHPVVLEARDVTGGAAITEQPWGPEFKVTALSYVMSLMPPTIIEGLQLERHGYKVHPMGPSYSPLPDGRAVHMSEDPSDRFESVAKFSKRDAQALLEYDAWLEGIAEVLGPLLTSVPPKVGSKRPRDLVDQLRTVWRLKGLNVRTAADTTRLFSMSIADLLREWFETPAVQGLMAVNGIIGTWAGPEAPGTAYVMLHHSIGDVGAGHLNAWGYPEGGTGAVSDAIRRAAESLGATVRTSTPVERVLVRNGRVTGVALADGHEIESDLVVTAIHPKITFLRQIDERDLPDDFVRRIRNWKTRSGTVKVNVALERAAGLRGGSRLTTAATSHRLDRDLPVARVPRDGVPAGGQRRRERSSVQRRRDPVDDGSLDLPRGHAHHEPLHAVGAGCVGGRTPPRGARGLRRPRDRCVRRGGPQLPALDHPPTGDRPV